MIPRVAIVGRPNVGKSRLFNSLAGRRVAIVHDRPGVTRDVQEVMIADGYALLDTGGLGLPTKDAPVKELVEAAEAQVFVAVQASALVLFVVDGREGLTAMDEVVASHLRRSGVPVRLVVNKLDNAGEETRLDEFARLGFGVGIGVSAEHGRGIDALRDAVLRQLGDTLRPPVAAPDAGRVRVCFAGRPNVGKSSLANRLLKSDRLVVSEVPGTTRDSVELDLDLDVADGGGKFRLVDTAGLRRRRSVDDVVEYFSTLRTEEAIARSDVVLLVIDAVDGITNQDKSVANLVLESGKSIVVLVNKWDLAIERFEAGALPGHERMTDFRKAFLDALRRQLAFLPDPPVLFVSALTGYRADHILKEVAAVHARSEETFPTPKVNQLVQRLFERQTPRFVGARRFKVYYAVQVGHRPFRFRLFCNHGGNLDDAYRRYLEHGFREQFGVKGTPIQFQLVGKPPRKGERAVG